MRCITNTSNENEEEEEEEVVVVVDQEDMIWKENKTRIFTSNWTKRKRRLLIVYNRQIVKAKEKTKYASLNMKGN